MKEKNFIFLVLFALAAVISSAAAISQSTISLNEAALFPEDI